MKDIAAELGISISTVSRVLRNDPHVSQKTRNRVLSIAQSKNFTKKKAVKNRIIYLIDKYYFLDTSNFYNPLIDVIENTARQQGYQFQFVTIESADSLLSKLDFSNVSGILVTSSFIEQLLPMIKMLAIPVVFVDSYLPLENTSAVLVDNVCGIIKAVKYLSDKGHRDIGFLEGDLADVDCIERLAGFKRALEMLKLPLTEAYILESKLSLSSSYQAMRGFLLESPVLPTAFIGVNDLVTIGAMQAVRDYGMSVPDQMSFIGFDDISLAKEVTPSLTTVRVDMRAMGMLSVQRLVELMNNKPVLFEKMIVNTSIVERNSVVAPRSGPRNKEVVDTIIAQV